jgi:hypothetical protein
MVAAAVLSGSASPRAQTPSTREAASSSEDATTAELPVSLDRIREGLAQPPRTPLLDALERTPDFRVEIEERRTLEEILADLIDVKTGAGPAPAGGLYAWEQQRRLFNPVDRPLAQPYAAFNSGELLTIAIENLMIKYLGGRLIDSVSAAERERAERDARAEVSRAITDYCAARPDRGRSLTICTTR